MKCEKTWLGTFYQPETEEEKQWLRESGYSKIVCGLGTGWWHK